MATVVVQCNYPNGVTLQLKGNPNTVVVNGYQNATIVEGGYGLTSGVDKDFMDAWVAENKQYPIYTNGCIAVNTSEDKAKKEAASNKGTVSGNEQVAPPKDATV